MGRVLSFFAWVFLSLAGLSAVLTILFSVDFATGGEDDAGAIFGGLALAAIFGVPGAIMRWRVRAGRRAEAFERQLRGYVNTLDSFTAGELSQKIGRTEMETCGLIARLVGEGHVELVFHRSSGRYMHRARVQEAHAVVDRCPSCGAATAHEIVFAGERATCRYCGQDLAGAR